MANKYEDFSTIDWVREAELENKQKQTQQWRFKSACQSWLVLALAGVIIGVIAAILNIVTEWLSDIKTGRCTVGFYLSKESCCSDTHHETCPEWKEWASWTIFDYILYILFAAWFAFIASFFVQSFAKYAAGSGISEIKCIVGGFVMRGFLGAKTLATKSLALPFAIASGLSVGKEGPSVHYAVCVGHVVARQFDKYKQYTKMREVLCACAAAGVAVAFGSPIGGVLFSIEEISTSFQLRTMWKSYFCALVSTAALAAMNPFRSGQVVLFSVIYNRSWDLFEIIPFIIIGVFGGLYGIFTSKWNLRAQAFRKKYLGPYPIQEAMVLATITAIICYFNQFLRIDMTESMQVLFAECEEDTKEDICNPDHRTRILFSLALAVVIRTLLVIISYGSKVPSGIFVPSMAIGALFGRFVGIVMQAIDARHPLCGADYPAATPCITPGVYAFLGAGAALSGIMNMTVTVVVIMFELTGAIRYVLPTMIVVGATKIVNDNWGKGGIADQAITANGFPFLHNTEHYYGVDVGEVMTANPTCLTTDMTEAQVDQIMQDNTHTGYPVITSTDTTAYINRKDYMRSKSLDGEGLVTTPVTMRHDAPLEQAVEIFQKLGPRVILVDDHTSTLQGIITQKDVLRYQNSIHPHQPSSSKVDEAAWELIKQAALWLRRLLPNLQSR